MSKRAARNRKRRKRARRDAWRIEKRAVAVLAGDAPRGWVANFRKLPVPYVLEKVALGLFYEEP